ncbi:hypothetical protein ACFSHQ_18925 [Gemmobacter lanyuensis]
MAILLMKPATLLLDEPFAALDLPTQARLSRRLAALPQRLITISHSPESVASCDQIVWIEGGRVQMCGAPKLSCPPSVPRWPVLERSMLTLTSPVETAFHRLPAGVKLGAVALGSVLALQVTSLAGVGLLLAGLAAAYLSQGWSLPGRPGARFRGFGRWWR